MARFLIFGVRSCRPFCIRDSHLFLFFQSNRQCVGVRPNPFPCPSLNTYEPELKRVVLSDSYSILVDDEDYPLVKTLKWHWSTSKKPKNPPYGGAFVTTIGISRLILLKSLVEALRKDPTSRVEHINGDVLDNRRSNLRIVSVSEMQRERWRMRAERKLREGMKCSRPSCNRKATHLVADDRWGRHRYQYACPLHSRENRLRIGSHPNPNIAQLGLI